MSLLGEDLVPGGHGGQWEIEFVVFVHLLSSGMHVIPQVSAVKL